jgi:hypothetical protein
MDQSFDDHSPIVETWGRPQLKCEKEDLLIQAISLESDPKWPPFHESGLQSGEVRTAPYQQAMNDSQREPITDSQREPITDSQQESLTDHQREPIVNIIRSPHQRPLSTHNNDVNVAAASDLGTPMNRPGTGTGAAGSISVITASPIKPRASSAQGKKVQPIIRFPTPNKPKVLNPSAPQYVVPQVSKRSLSYEQLRKEKRISTMVENVKTALGHHPPPSSNPSVSLCMSERIGVQLPKSGSKQGQQHAATVKCIELLHDLEMNSFMTD